MNPFAMAADLLDSGSAVNQQRAAREAIRNDPRKLLDYVWILHPVDGPEPFKPWPWQIALLIIWTSNRLVSVLKARQLGVSWLAAMFALWLAMFHSGQSVLIISKGQWEANKFLEKVKFIYNHLPEWLRVPADLNVTSIRFASLDSEIHALPATEGVGRSATASLVILDEHAHQPWAREIYLALKPAVEKGRVLSVSTANGLAALHTNIYHAAKDGRPLRRVRLPNGVEVPLLVGAKVGRNGYRAVFVPASAHPDRQTEGWREQAWSELEGVSRAKFEQEYPEDDEEAFIRTGRPVFNTGDLKKQMIEPGMEDEPGLVIYRERVPGKFYLVGADCSEGLGDSDWSSAGVFERDTMEQVAQLRGRWAPDVYAARLDRLARRYGDAKNWEPLVIMGVERNNHGHAVLLRLRQLHGDHAPYAIYRAKDKRQGWATTSATRPVMIDQLEAAIRTDGMLLHDAGTLEQFSTFHWSDDGKPEAQEGAFDDDVMAAGIALQVRRTSFGRVLDVANKEASAA